MDDKPATISVDRAVETVRSGQLIIIVDDEDRENEGDLMVAAEKITPEIINFMTKHGRGLICLPLTRERLKELHLPLMVRENTAPYQTAFTVSIDAKEGISTGISAYDRARLRPSIPGPGRKTSPAPDTSSLSRPTREESWPEPARPRPPWTSPVWRASTPRASSARS
jgi:3,4-dihydroxy-2-butanone 4-phosphate synthase